MIPSLTPNASGLIANADTNERNPPSFKSYGYLFTIWINISVAMARHYLRSGPKAIVARMVQVIITLVGRIRGSAKRVPSVTPLESIAPADCESATRCGPALR